MNSYQQREVCWTPGRLTEHQMVETILSEAGDHTGIYQNLPKVPRFRRDFCVRRNDMNGFYPSIWGNIETLVELSNKAT